MKGDSALLVIVKNTNQKMLNKNNNLGAQLDNTKKIWYYEI